jgi:ketosteroid isomerase-like protein
VGAPSAKWFADLADAYNSGDLEAFLSRFDPEVVLDPDPQWPEPGPVFSRDAFGRFLEDWARAWQAVRVEVEGVEEHGDAVVARCRWIVSGAASGAAVPTAFTVVLRFGPNGLVSRISAFFDHDEALRSIRR